MDFSILIRSLILVLFILGYTYIQRNLDFHTSVCMVNARFLIIEYYLCSHIQQNSEKNDTAEPYCRFITIKCQRCVEDMAPGVL